MAVWMFMSESLQPDVSGLNDGAPSHSLLAHETGHGVRVAADRLRRETIEPLAHVRQADRLGNVGADLVDDVARRLRRRGDGEPRRRGKPRQRLDDRRYVG